MVAPEGNLCLFKSWLSIQVLRECKGVATKNRDEQNASGSSIPRTVNVFARFDALIVTVVASLREDGKNGVEAHRKKA